MPHFLSLPQNSANDQVDTTSMSNTSPFKHQGHNSSLHPHLLFQELLLNPLISHLTFSHSHLLFLPHLGTRSFWNSSDYAASLRKNVWWLPVAESSSYSSDRFQCPKNMASGRDNCSFFLPRSSFFFLVGALKILYGYPFPPLPKTIWIGWHWLFLLVLGVSIRYILHIGTGSQRGRNDLNQSNESLFRDFGLNSWEKAAHFFVQTTRNGCNKRLKLLGVNR